jgi:hypothetical protein
MSHSDEAIEGQQKESVEWRLGYAQSAIRTAIWMIEIGRTDKALANLKETAEVVK